MSRNYDYIIVGGGSSGCALASALAKKGKVLLVEKGANHTAYPQSKVKEGWPQIAGLVVSALRNKGSGHWTGTANVLGGGSAMNAGVCVRGQKDIFTSLGIDLSLAEKAFQFLERTICLPADYEEFQKIYEDAWKERGDYFRLPGYTYGSWIEEALRDNNVSFSDGSDHGYRKSIQVANTIMPTKDNDERRPASFLFEKSFDQKPSILDQGNLTVLLLTQAKKIIFNDDKEAIGVDLISPAGNFTVYVRREGKVFLNAGVYETPKLLMLSGIGPRATLEKYDIPVVYENEHVGLHLQDRKSSYITLAGLKDIAGDDTAVIEVLAISEKTWSYMSNKNALVWGNAFGRCNTCAPVHRTNSCATQILAAAMFYGSGYHDTGPHYLPITVVARYPETRGNITLASSSYKDNVIVQDGWSTNINDLKIPALNDFNDIVEGVQDQIIKFLQETSILEKLGTISNSTLNGEFSTELQDFIATSQDQRQKASELLDECKFNENPLGDCVSTDTCVPTTPSLPVNDSTALREIVFNSLGSTWHMTGTCRVGDVVKKGSLEVIGVKNLHISDLSILDETVDTHPFMTAMVIGITVGDNTSPVQSGNFEYFPVILSTFCCVIILLIPCILIFKVMYGKLKKKRKVTDYRSLRESMARSLRAQATEEVTILEWKDVCCSYETKAGTKTTLLNNTGKIVSGELTALMGPSGSSKSTLLDILAGRKSEGRISGTFDVLAQHVDASKDGVSRITTAMKNHSAYIPQQEFFYPTQTCFEAVNFVANMRLGKSKNENQRKAFISLCLDDVGLPSEEFADRKIGGDLPGGINIRGLSGGERKRLVLATALALKPRVMFIDEITRYVDIYQSGDNSLLKVIYSPFEMFATISGLDSENSLLIIELLRKLSREKNVASVVIIHQPSAKVFKNFDNLLLLAKGRPVYAGPLEELSQFYERNYDEGMPQDYDLANDLIVKAIAHQTQRVADHWAGPLQANTDDIPLQSESEEKIDLGRIEGTSMISENDLAENEMSMRDSENSIPNDESEMSYADHPMMKETETQRAADESVISFEDNPKSEHFPGLSNSEKESNPVTIEFKVPLKSSINSAVIDLDKGGKSYTEDFPSANKIDLGIVRDEWNNNQFNPQLNPQHPLYSSNEKENRTTSLESYAQPPSFWKLTTVFKRNLKNQYLSNIANVVGRLASYTILSILIGAIFFQVGKGANSSSDGLTFTEAELLIRTNIFVLNVSYLLPFSSIPVFVGDKRFFVAESALGLYSPWMYGLSQVVLETLFVTLAAIIQTCIIIPMCSMVNPSFSVLISFMTMLAALIMSGLVGSTLVFLCSMALPSQDLAFVAGSTIVTISLALSGGFLPFSEMSAFPYALQWLSPVKYSMQALLTSQLDGTSSERLLDIGEFNTPSTVSDNLGVLVGIFLLLALLSGIAMTRLKETR